MSNKVDIAEVEAFSNDLEEISSNVRSSLDKVQERIDAVNNMESFSGKAAKEAKGYFNELHLTLLESFRGLFDDLNENLKQHIKSFGTEVDASESAIIESNYLQDVKEDINDVFESLKEQQESIQETIQDVSDISSTTSPDFSDVQEWKKKSVKKIQEVDEDLDAFTSKGNEVDIGEIMHQIEAVMSKATTSKGKARFADFRGASEMKNLGKLQDYNADKKAKMEAKIEKLGPEAKEYLEIAKADYNNGEIDKTTLEAITRGLINGGNGFLIALINNKDTKVLGSVDAEKVYQWGQEHRDIFVDPKILLQEQQKLGFNGEKGGYETKEVWNINLKLNTYKLEQAHAIQADNNVALEKANKKEEQLRAKYSDLSEHLISEGEPPQDLQEPLTLENGEKLYYRIDSSGHLHYKAEEGYEYYEENHKQTKGGYIQGVVAKTATSALATRGAGNLVTKLPQWAQTGSTYVGITGGLATELSGNSSWNVMYVPNSGEVKTMVYRTDEKTGEIENLIIDTQGNEVIKLRSWKEY